MHRSRRVVAAAASVSMALATGIAAAHADGAPILYVNNAAAADCTDTGSGAGSAATPFCTIQAAADAAVAGDTVEIATGHYAAAEITSSGTAQAPIVFESTGNVAIEGSDTGALEFDGASYVDVEGRATEGVGNELNVGSALITGGSSHITLDSLHLSGKAEIAGTASAVTISRDIVIGGVTVEAGSSDDVISTNWIPGFGSISVTDASNVAITSNTLTSQSTSADVINVTGGSTGVSIQNNIVAYPSSASGSGAEIAVDASSAPGTTLDYNVVWPEQYDQDGDVLEAAYSWAGTDYASASALDQATGQAQHDLNADPDLNGFPYFETATAPQVNSANSAAPGMLDTDMFGEPCTGNPVIAVSGAGSPDYCARGAFQGAYTATLNMSTTPVNALSVSLNSTMALLLNTNGTGGSSEEDLTATPAVSYSVNWGDGSTGTYTASAADLGTSVPHTYAQPGTYTITDTADLTDGTTTTETGTFTTTAAGAGNLFHNTRASNGAWASNWDEPASTPDLAQAAITGMPNGDTQVVAVTTGGVLEHTVYDSSDGQWQAWGIPRLNPATAVSASIAGMPDGSSQVIEVTSTSTLEHTIRYANGSWQTTGWGSPAGSTGIAQAAITAMPNGSSQLVAVTTGGTLEHNIRNANGSWQGWRTLSQPGVKVTDASIAGMPNGSSQIIEVTSTGTLEHDIRNANGSWQTTGWGSPAGSTGIAQAAITAMPNGSTQLAAVTASGALEHDARNANGSWQGWQEPAQTDLAAAVTSPSIAGLPNGSSQIVEVSMN